jgi:hypothetical protein
MAKDSTYEALFQAIVKAIHTDNKLKKEVNVADLASWVMGSKTSILTYYGKINGLVKLLYMEKEGCLLDRHKCGACFMIAFLQKLDNKNSLWIKYEKYRERLAILVGLTVMGTFIMSEDRTVENAVILDALTKNRTLKFPEKLYEKTYPYYKTWSLELRDAYKYGGFSVLALANELFLIERYNRDCAQ